MSVETLATIAAIVGVGVTLLVSLFGGFAWVIRRTDSQSEALGARLDARIDSLGSTVVARIDSLGSTIDARLGNVERELVEVKVALARIEGPRPRFTTVR